MSARVDVIEDVLIHHRHVKDGLCSCGHQTRLGASIKHPAEMVELALVQAERTGPAGPEPGVTLTHEEARLAAEALTRTADQLGPDIGTPHRIRRLAWRLNPPPYPGKPEPDPHA